jgi:regulator of cell morphogenesis and NO signaling
MPLWRRLCCLNNQKNHREMTITKDARVGEVATEFPLATRVFHRHGLDFCCGGGKSLSDACAKRDVDPELVLQEICKELEAATEEPERWDQAPLEDLVKHILLTYHVPLHEELPRLEAMAQRVATVHGDKDPEVLHELAAVVTRLKAELDDHMAKEEQILFPMVLAGKGFLAEGPMAVMEEEHESAGKALRRLRELTKDYQVPEGACNTWRALWHGLAALETDMHNHIHLENNILFPRARAAAAQAVAG